MPLPSPGIEVGGIGCSACPVGEASGASASQMCPFISRTHLKREILCTAGDPADYVWFIKEGVVALGRSRSDHDRLDALRLPGSFVGLECLVSERAIATARVMTTATLCGATRDGFLAWVRQSDERLAVAFRAALADPLLASEIHAPGGRTGSRSW